MIRLWPLFRFNIFTLIAWKKLIIINILIAIKVKWLCQIEYVYTVNMDAILTFLL